MYVWEDVKKVLEEKRPHEEETFNFGIHYKARANNSWFIYFHSIRRMHEDPAGHWITSNRGIYECTQIVSYPCLHSLYCWCAHEQLIGDFKSLQFNILDSHSPPLFLNCGLSNVWKSHLLRYGSTHRGVGEAEKRRRRWRCYEAKALNLIITKETMEM